jgi:hypothetical protein
MWRRWRRKRKRKRKRKRRRRRCTGCNHDEEIDVRVVVVACISLQSNRVSSSSQRHCDRRAVDERVPSARRCEHHLALSHAVHVEAEAAAVVEAVGEAHDQRG